MSVDITHLHIEYPTKRVFDDVNLTVHDNEIVAIETQVLDGGTSFLKAIAGLLTGVDGQVLFEGVDILHGAPESTQFRIGFVYEEHGLVSLYNVFQNIGLPLQYHTDMTPEEIATEVKDICAYVGIPPVMYDHMPHELNDVQTRLVNLARALAQKPGLLLIDELEGGMSDEILSATMDKLRQRQQQFPMAIIIATSSPIIMAKCDRRLAIENYGLTERSEP